MTARISAEANLLERIHLFRTDWQQQGSGDLKRFIRECQQLREARPEVWTKRVALAYVELLTDIKDRPAPSRREESYASRNRSIRNGYSAGAPVECDIYFDLTKASEERPLDTVRNIPEVMEFLNNLKRPHGASRPIDKRYYTTTVYDGRPKSVLGASRECDTIHEHQIARSNVMHNDCDRSSWSQQSTRPSSEQGDVATAVTSTTAPSLVEKNNAWETMFYQRRPTNSYLQSQLPTAMHSKRTLEAAAQNTRQLSNRSNHTIKHSTEILVLVDLDDISRGFESDFMPIVEKMKRPKCPDAWIPGHECDELCSTLLYGLEDQLTSRG